MVVVVVVVVVGCCGCGCWLKKKGKVSFVKGIKKGGMTTLGVSFCRGSGILFSKVRTNHIRSLAAGAICFHTRHQCPC